MEVTVGLYLSNPPNHKLELKNKMKKSIKCMMTSMEDNNLAQIN